MSPPRTDLAESDRCGAQPASGIAEKAPGSGLRLHDIYCGEKIMEIKFNSNPLLDPYAAGTEKTGEVRSRAAKGNSGDVASGDTVSVSQDALLLTEARRAAQNAPDVRADKVEALRIQVADGTYKPDSSLIAAKLIREEPGLFRL